MQFQNKSTRSVSPMNRKEQVSIIERSQSPYLRQENIQMTKFYNRFYKQEQRYRLLQEQIDEEIKAKANSKKITENSYRIVAHYLQTRILEALKLFEKTVNFAQLGTIFTNLNIFDAIQFDDESKLIINEKIHQTSKGKQEVNYFYIEMLMHEFFWNIVSDNGRLEEVDVEIVNYLMRILMDPIKLSVNETADLLIDMLNYDTTQNYEHLLDLSRRLVLQFRALTQDKLFTHHTDRKKDEENKYKEQILRELTFTPTLNKKSIILATQNRQKYLGDRQLSSALFGESQYSEMHNTECISVMLKKQEEAQLKRAEQQQLKEKEKQRECTFQPSINKNYQFENKMDVVSRLYSEESVQYKRVQRQQNEQMIREYREQEEISQCTFVPSINDCIQYNTPSTPKDYDRTVGRMRHALEQKQKLEKMKNVPIGEKYEKNKNAPFNPPEMVYRQKIKRQPLVIMDVNICPGKQGRLALYEEEDARLVVRNFAKLFKLNQEMQDTLLQVLETEKEKILNRNAT